MDLLSLTNLWQPLATALGAFSVFPEQPALLKELSTNEWFRWFLVYVLILQGGADWKWDLALVATIVTYLLVRVLDMAYNARECPPQPVCNGAEPPANGAEAPVNGAEPPVEAPPAEVAPVDVPAPAPAGVEGFRGGFRKWY